MNSARLIATRPAASSVLSRTGSLAGTGSLSRTQIVFRRRPQGGAILIVALGVLTLLAVLGATFAQLMNLEKKAADNYEEAQHMDLLTGSALDMVIAQLHDRSNRRSWSQYGPKTLPWLYLLKDEQDLAHGRALIDDPRVGQWTVYSQWGGKRFRFKTKVIDAASQINLNGRQDTLARMLDHLGEAIAASPRMGREKSRGRLITNPFYTGPHRSGHRVFGWNIMQFRQRLEGQRFQSKSQLRQLIGDQNYQVVKDFLTCWSWEDPYTYGPADGLDEVPDLSQGGTQAGGAGGGGGGLGGAASGLAQSPASDNPRIVHEPRHPININTAPEEVLIATLQGLAGRRVFPYSQFVGGGGLQTIDQNAQILGERIFFGQEEVRDVRPRAIYVYSQPLGPLHARQIAQRIIAHRKTGGNAFRAWRTHDVRQLGFEDFIDRLENDFFPSPNNVEVIDPLQPTFTALRSRILQGGDTPTGRMWIRGTAQAGTASTMRQLGLAVHDTYDWYYSMMKSIIKGNFNPNTRINRYNPNAPAYIPVDKSGLVWAETREVLRKGHTTEYCFDTMGIYEITTLGELVDLSKVQGAGTTVVDSLARKVKTGGHPFRRKVRTVVKIFDVLRHTNQAHFEKTFNVGSRSSQNDRRNVVTWPEPMAVLTELMSTGSTRDGRVELAGLLDARRLQASMRSRASFVGQHPSVLAEHSFLIRSDRSLSRLQQISQRGGAIGLGGDEKSTVLRDIFDFDFSRYERTNNQPYYRRKDLVAQGLFVTGNADWRDPLVGKTSIGTDLFPDGLNTSILRMSQFQSRLLVLPARQRIGAIGLGGAGNPKIGASGLGSRGQNVRGNVPYYSGGLAFWVKFEFDGRDPVFSGLLGCTQVIKEVSLAIQDFTGSEGTQFFVFKNSVGQLRIVRMYYHQAFPEAGLGIGGGAGAAGIPQLYPDPGTGGVTDTNNPILDNLDHRKWISRSDILVDVRHFKAHEWHHVAIDWNDQNPVFPIRLFLDFQEVREGGVPRKPQQVVDGTANSWVRLNERQPRDGLQICGIVREQGVADAGVFKWFTNTARLGGTSSGVRTVAPQVKRLLANATIDEFITYEGTFGGAKSFYGGRGQPGYFTNQAGEYANVFEVPLPPEVHQVVLRSFDWTSYYPTTFTDSLPNSVPLPLQMGTPITCDISLLGPTKPRTAREPWREPSLENFVAGTIARRRTSDVRGSNAKVVYKFTMVGARSQKGNTAGGVVQTPVIDDVTLTYFLPSPKILLQEEGI